MITLRPAAERGTTRIDWLDSRHSFSFAEYFDPEHMGFRALRVINDDRVAAGGGFPTHPHRDMEILTYVLEGALQHRDSLGNGSVIRPGEVQRMSAGTGVLHSEFNASKTDGVHFLQIWILPDRRDVAPSYEQKLLPPADAHTGMQLVASPDGRHGSVKIHQDASVYVAQLQPGGSATYGLATVRRAWVQIARGAVDLNGHAASAGDGARLEGESGVRLRSDSGCEVLLFDLP